MKKYELIIGLTALAALALKLNHVPFGGMLLVLSLGALSMFYYIFSYALFYDLYPPKLNQAYKNVNSKKVREATILGLALSLIPVGILFKLQFWPGANMFLLWGSILLLIAIFYFRNNEDMYPAVFKRCIIYAALGLLLFFTPSSTLVDIIYKDNPAYAALFKKVIANPDDTELRKQLDEMRNEMNGKKINVGSEKNK